MIECPYCGARANLRYTVPPGSPTSPDYICLDCFQGRDDGPYFDDLTPVPDHRRVSCENCGGTGYLSPEAGWEECSVCAGTGRVDVVTTTTALTDLDANTSEVGQ
jgi:hypothetical protein